jgi:diguanylate cyclase (GGDEF)-like protein
MHTEIITYGDVLRHTANRMVIAVCSTFILFLCLLGVVYGMNPDTQVRLGQVAAVGAAIGVIIAALLTGLLAYRSSLLMQELYLAREELMRISRTDQLTGLLNRRGFDEAANKAVGSWNVSSAALMCDIDHFKSINDRFGHEFGDRVLVKVSNAMRSFGIANDILIARHGGEEFAGFMIGVTAERASQLAEELRRVCADTKLSTAGGPLVSVTISIGVAAAKDPTPVPILMRAADNALYFAKQSGRDRVVPAIVRDDAVAA